MKLLLATNHLGLGGSESYLLTVAEQFDRLGHEVAVFAPESGGGTDVARERGIRLIGEGDLGDDFDVALVQDAAVSYQVADSCPGLPQLFIAHSELFDLQAPPQLDGMVGAIVALNNRVATRMRSFATEVEVVRMRQPIDTERFAPRGGLAEVPRSVLLLSNTPHADRLALLETACTDLGLELTRVGGRSGLTDIQPALQKAEIVIGYGRSILEAMACGRAAYVYDWKGGDGWVTTESYRRIEADGIAGGGGKEMVDAERLAEDLRRYEASMGAVNRDLVIAHHRANVHAQELLALLERLRQPTPRPRAPMQEMARLVRLEWRARVDVDGLKQENAHLRELFLERQQQLERVQDEAKTSMEAEAAKRNEAIQAYESTASWRLTRPLRALGRMRRRWKAH